MVQLTFLDTEFILHPVIFLNKGIDFLDQKVPYFRYPITWQDRAKKKERREKEREIDGFILFPLSFFSVKNYHLNTIYRVFFLHG